jgi:hypothetical protein
MGPERETMVFAQTTAPLLPGFLNIVTDTRFGSSASQHCARCGAVLRCGQQMGDATCWCASMPVLPANKLAPRLACLCPACLSREINPIEGK